MTEGKKGYDRLRRRKAEEKYGERDFFKGRKFLERKGAKKLER